MAKEDKVKMANIQKASSDSKEKSATAKTVVIHPRNDAEAEGYVFINGMNLPFEQKIRLSVETITAIEGLKEPQQVKKKKTVQDIMQEHAVSHEVAVQIYGAQSAHPDLGNTSFEWKAKYFVEVVSVG